MPYETSFLILFVIKEKDLKFFIRYVNIKITGVQMVQFLQFNLILPWIYYLRKLLKRITDSILL